MLLRDGFNLFFRHLGTEYIDGIPGRNLEKETIAWYRRMLRPLRLHAERDYGVDVTVADISTDFLNDYKLAIKREVAVSTANGRISALKSFFNRMVEFDVIPYSPALRIKKSKVQNAVPKAHARDIVGLLRQVSLALPTRVALSIHLLTITGARADEIVSLRWKDLQFGRETGRATVIGKNDKQRTLFFGRAECDLLRKYRGLRDGFVAWYRDFHPDVEDEDQVFWGMSGPMGYAGLYNDFQKCVQIASVELSGRPIHGLRHSFAKNWLARGGDLASLQDALGHADISTTKIYLQLSDDELEERHGRFAGFDEP